MTIGTQTIIFPEYVGDTSRLLNLIFDYLTELLESSQEYSHAALFINSECDSNQTTYEHHSNHGMIGVEAHSKREGYIKSHLLRVLIDDNLHLLHIPFYDCEEDVYCLETYIDHLIEDEAEHMQIFEHDPEDREISWELRGANGTTEIKKTRSSVEIYSTARLKRELCKQQD